MFLAQRLAHTVKSVSGNIGAVDLEKTSASLERSLKEERNSDINEFLQSFCEELSRVLQALGSWDGLEPDSPGIQSSDPVNTSELLSVFEELALNARMSKFKQCKNLMEKAKSMPWPQEITEELLRLEQLIGAFQYDDATPVLESIIDTILKIGEDNG